MTRRFPEIKGPRNDDICYATQNRQDAVKDLAKECDLILVVGSANSSNSNRLRELGERLGVPSYLIDDESEIDPLWFQGVQRVGLTSGASAPESLVERVIARLNCIEEATIENIITREESIEFPLPKALR
jgi:4-hydroxy-3-methylbut-2-enyl diphosphate reductase